MRAHCLKSECIVDEPRDLERIERGERYGAPGSLRNCG